MKSDKVYSLSLSLSTSFALIPSLIHAINAFSCAALVSLESRSDSSDRLYPSLVLILFSDPKSVTSSVMKEILFKDDSISFNNSLAMLHKYVAEVEVIPLSPKNTLFSFLISII